MDNTVKSKIITRLREIENEHNVEILYAIESGSRAWGFESRDSDYDVRFIYRHERDWYLNILPRKDVIEYPIIDEYDYSGWDLRKTFFLMNKSNPVFFEWLRSPIIYLENKKALEIMLSAADCYFSPIASIYHYLHMAKGNFREYLKKDLVKIKKYFYVLRPILACMWIEQKDTSPPVEFEVLLKEMIDDIDLLAAVNGLLEKRKSGKELGLEPVVPEINDFIEEKLRHFEGIAASFNPGEKPDAEFLDKKFVEILNLPFLGGKKF